MNIIGYFVIDVDKTYADRSIDGATIFPQIGTKFQNAAACDGATI